MERPNKKIRMLVGKETYKGILEVNIIKQIEMNETIKNVSQEKEETIRNPTI